MRCILLFVATITLLGALRAETPLPTPSTPTLRSVYAGDFLLGVALNRQTVDGRAAKAAVIAGRQFSALTAENDMKWQGLHPAPDRYHYAAADSYVEFARAHDMAVIGHTLVWHSQTPEWVFKDEHGAPASRDLLLARMRDHIHRVVGRYRGKIKGWDVVNEAISDGPGGLRDSPWRQLIGDDFIDHAFRYAHEADPEAELYYNDYGMENPGKRARALAMLRGLIERGVPIHGVGMQGHYSLTWPALHEVEQTITDFAALKLRVMITELDVDVLPQRGPSGVADISRREAAQAALNPYVAGLPDAIQTRLAERYAELFGVFMRHRNEITRVTFWGIDDGGSWLNSFPIQGRTNYPLLIGRDLLPKPAFFAVLEVGRTSAR